MHTAGPIRLPGTHQGCHYILRRRCSGTPGGCQIYNHVLRLELERVEDGLEVLLHSLIVVVVGSIEGDTIIVLVMQDRKDGEVIRQLVAIRECGILLGPLDSPYSELRIRGRDSVQVNDTLVTSERINIGLVDLLDGRPSERFRGNTFDGHIDA